MKTTHLTLTAATAMLAAVQLLVAVRVSSEEQKEKRIAFRTSENKYITASPNLSLDLSGTAVGSKQTFTLIDLNGGKLADGDQVRIQYIPGSATKPDPSKASFWQMAGDGVKRGHDGDVFKIKLVKPKDALNTSSGIPAAEPGEESALAVTNGQESASLVKTRYVFQTPGGEFVAGPVQEGLLAVTNSLEGALLVDIVDVVPKGSAPKTSK